MRTPPRSCHHPPVRLLLLLSLLAFAVPAQAGDPPAIKKIRALYNKVKKAELYETRVDVNPGGLDAPGSGNYHKLVHLYWEWPGGGAKVLRRVEVKAEIAAPTYHQELVFDDAGKLAFALRKGGYDDVVQRFYFAAGKLVRVIDGEDTRDSPTKADREIAAAMQDAAKRYAKLLEAVSATRLP